MILEARKVENWQKIDQKVNSELFEVAYEEGRTHQKTFKTDFGRFWPILEFQKVRNARRLNAPGGIRGALKSGRIGIGILSLLFSLHGLRAFRRAR